MLRLSHGLSTMRGGGGGGRRDPRGCCDLQPVSFVLPIAASPVRRADDSSRDIYRHVPNVTLLTDYLRRFGVR